VGRSLLLVWIPEDDETTVQGLPERAFLDLPRATQGVSESAVIDLPDPRAPLSTDGTVDDEEVVSIGELLDGERSDAVEPTEVAIVRLASLLGISALVVAVMILIVVIGWDLDSLFRSLPVT
jgi:hypothetical protein